MDSDELHERPAPDGTWPEDGTGALIEHKGHAYRVERIEPSSWVIRSEDGRTIGSLFVLSAEGESGDPVYGGRKPGELETYTEGSDWRGIVKALVNEVP